MKALTATEVKRAAVMKAVKSNVRLKYAIAADEELNRILPEIAAEFDKAMAEGRFFELDVSSFLSEADSCHLCGPTCKQPGVNHR